MKHFNLIVSVVALSLALGTLYMNHKIEKRYECLNKAETPTQRYICFK